MAKGTLSIAGADTLTAADLAADSVGSSEIAAGAVGASELADGAVTSAKMYGLGDGTGDLTGTVSAQQLHFADTFTLTGDLTVNDDLTLGKLRNDGTGQTLTHTASTARILTGTGTLRMGSAVEQTSVNGMTGVLDSAVTGGTGLSWWRLIGTSVASGSATLDQTGLESSSYDMYAIVLADIIPATDGAEFKMRMGDSSGIDSGGSDYDYHCSNLTDASASYAAQVSNGADYIKINPNVGSAAVEGFSAMLYLSNPAASAVGPMVFGNHFGIINSGVSQGGPLIGRRVAAINLDRIQVFFSSGNIASGRMSVYGISHA